MHDGSSATDTCKFHALVITIEGLITREVNCSENNQRTLPTLTPDLFNSAAPVSSLQPDLRGTGRLQESTLELKETTSAHISLTSAIAASTENKPPGKEKTSSRRNMHRGNPETIFKG
ncbi:hypothetical protein RRG08_021198 [Elysia crispata]|uniref:Uncharacterized protein n=1 Tax=Elysia crispata TaxID=231223 RepID=A0AAE0YP79_9GAST|nr:hypothetical protein RRG08_021198 [Elysia crispata]